MGTPARQVVRVDLAERSYDVTIGPGVLDEVGHWARHVTPHGRRVRRAALVVDDKLPVETVDRACGSLAAAGLEVTTIPAHASETDKSLAQLERLLVAFSQARLERGEPVIALGGGIVGDLAGFAAAVYRRGVPVIQCPTTLLSMVDASVGGKTGANLEAGGALLKNLVGAFHQPRVVLADVSTLRSLPRREFNSGLAECVKHGMIGADCGDPTLLEWITAQAGRIREMDESTLTVLVSRNVSVKAEVVAGDEREELPSAAGGRALLNLGHTFGHAIETIPHLSPDDNPRNAPLFHGEAISLGLCAACSLGAGLGLLGTETGERISSLLRSLELPTKVAGLPATPELIERMAHDKKTVGGTLRFVVPVDGVRARIIENPPVERVSAAVDAMRL